MDETKQQIIYENNILIARFMGGEIDSNGIIQKSPKRAGFFCEGYNANGFLLYDDSWEWIMPVVEKIEKDFPEYTIVIYEKITQIGEDDFIGETKLESVYKAVSYFVYNYFQTFN